MPLATAPAPPLVLSRRLLVGVPVAVVVLSGLAVPAAFVVGGSEAWDLGDVGFSILNAGMYVSVMWPLSVVVLQWTLARWPLRGAADVGRHVAAQVGTTVVGFVVASGAVRLLLGVVYHPALFAVVAGVAALSTAVLSAVLYGTLAAQRLRASEAAAVAAELRALRAQINPHFLFNALNTVAALVRTRPAQAERVVEDLADLFRYSLAASERPDVTLAQELASAELFLGIERARYGDDLAVSVDVPQPLRRARVPSLVLQPLVENAVKHGVRRAGGRGTVSVTARREGADLVVRVSDTGPGFGTDDLADVLGRGTGLTNVADRLSAALGHRASLALGSGGGGTVVVRFPYQDSP